MTRLEDPGKASRLRDFLDREARAAGFDAIAVTRAEAAPVTSERLATFVSLGRHGTMEWMADRSGARARFHNWWNAPATWAKVQQIDPQASHASWMENFPWTRLPGRTLPEQRKPMVDFDRLKDRDAKAVRDLIGDGNYGGHYQRGDADSEALWSAGVAETRALLEGDWA